MTNQEMMRSHLRILLALVTVLVSVTGVADASHARYPRWKPRLTVNSDNPVYLDLFAGGRGYALQHESPLYQTSDFGRTWTARPAPDGAYVADFASPAIGYVFTTDQAGREILRTRDGGETWAAIPKPPALPLGATSAGAYFDRMAAPAKDVLFLGGSVSRYYEPCRWESRVAIYRSIDGGLTFIPTEFPYPGVVHELEMLDEMHGVALVSEWEQTSDPIKCSSSSTSIRMHALVTHNGGITWTGFANESFDFGAAPTKMGIHSVGIASPSRLLLGMLNGDILTSHDGGLTFLRAGGTRNGSYPSVDPHYLSRIDAIKFATPNVGYVMSAHGAVWKTTDGGLTWGQERSVQAAGGYSFSSGLAVANGRRAILAAHTRISNRVLPH